MNSTFIIENIPGIYKIDNIKEEKNEVKKQNKSNKYIAPKNPVKEGYSFTDSYKDNKFDVPENQRKYCIKTDKGPDMFGNIVKVGNTVICPAGNDDDYEPQGYFIFCKVMKIEYSVIGEDLFRYEYTVCEINNVDTDSDFYDPDNDPDEYDPDKERYYRKFDLTDIIKINKKFFTNIWLKKIKK